jgi:hypothetical protein
MLLVVPLAACNSVYHRARADLPPSAPDRLRLRIEEARQSEAAAREAARRVAETPNALPEDIDRLEVAARDVFRRSLAVRDVEPLGQEGDREVAHLQFTSDVLLGAVRMARAGKPRAAARMIDLALIERVPESGGVAMTGGTGH